MPVLHPLGRYIARASYRVNSQLRENQRAGRSYALTRALISDDAAMRGSAITRPRKRSAFYRWTTEKWDKCQPSGVNDCSSIDNKDDEFIRRIYAPFILPANEKLLHDVVDSRAPFIRTLTSGNCVTGHILGVLSWWEPHDRGASELSRCDEDCRRCIIVIFSDELYESRTLHSLRYLQFQTIAYFKLILMQGRKESRMLRNVNGNREDRLSLNYQVNYQVVSKFCRVTSLHYISVLAILRQKVARYCNCSSW